MEAVVAETAKLNKSSTRAGKSSAKDNPDLAAAVAAVLKQPPEIKPASRSLTDITITPVKEVEKDTKQALKRKRKRYIKKLLQSVLQFRKNKNVKQSHYYAYVNDKLNHYSGDTTAKFFEEEGGFLALSMVKDIRAITEEERQVIAVFEDIRKRYTKELATNK